MSKILRTPEHCFYKLHGFDYEPHYVEQLSGYEGLRVHYVDEGPLEGEVFFCIHGQPTWSYLYRKMIPIFTKNGYRVIAPDLIGFGRTDKPVDDREYTFEFHRKMLVSFLKWQNLSNITLVCQDWGGFLGLTLPMEFPKQFKRLIIMNTSLGTGDYPLSDGFLAWRAWAAKNPDMDIGRLMKRSCPHLSEEEAKSYSAPFPDVRYKAGVRRFPQLVPESPSSPGAKISQASRDFLSKEWKGKSFMAIGMKDPVLGPEVMNSLRNLIAGCNAPMEVPSAGHFVQEWGEDIAAKAIDYFETVVG